jgi:hypothetical protein
VNILTVGASDDDAHARHCADGHDFGRGGHEPTEAGDCLDIDLPDFHARLANPLKIPNA